MEAISPDAFLVSLHQQNPERMAEVIEAQAGDLEMPEDAILSKLSAGLPKFVEVVRERGRQR